MVTLGRWSQFQGGHIPRFYSAMLLYDTDAVLSFFSEFQTGKAKSGHIGKVVTIPGWSHSKVLSWNAVV